MRKSAKEVFDLLVDGGLKKRNGWMSELERLGFEEDELIEIGEIENENMKQKYDNSFYRKNLSEWKKDDSNKEFQLDIFRDKIDEFKKEYKRICDKNYNDKQNNISYIVRKFTMAISGIDEIEKSIKLFKFKYRVLAYYDKRNGKGKIDEYAIVRAREYPISNIYEAKRNFILCPYHDDKHPSMFIKNNFGYCFVCGANVDSIDLMMNKLGLSFVDAVQNMQ